MNPEEKRQLEELMEFKRLLQSSNTIPLPVDQAFRQRLGTASLSQSSKSATSQNQFVNEAGTSAYYVLGVPTGYLQITINNVTYYVPYF